MSESGLKNIPLRALLAGSRCKQIGLIQLARKLVQSESPSNVKAAVDACIALAASRAKQIDGRIRVHRQHHFGDVLEVRFGPRRKVSSAKKPLLLLGHLDTVWPLGTIERMAWRVEKERLWGPGVLDMKAGVAMALTAIELLIDAELLKQEIVLLLNGDEEIGSPASRPIIEELARQCEAVYVLEPAQGLAYKTARKGIGNWQIEVKGIAAHSGVDFEKGANAIREMARLVEKVSGWTDLQRGLTVNVGVIDGGTKSNVVPAAARAEVDVRIARRADGPRITRRFSTLKPTDPRCSLAITGGIDRPPMERSRGTVRLFRKAQEYARGLGFQLDEASTGGASDGNLTAALGIPTLDGMGAVGEGAHASHESVCIEHLAPRTALLAAMLVD